MTAAAGAGIGFSTAQRCAEEGARLFISDIHEKRVEEAAGKLEEISGQSVGRRLCNVTQEEDVQALVAAAIESMGHVDVLINNAGLGGEAPVVEMTDDQWLGVIDVTLHSVFRMTRAILPHMMERRFGRVVNLVSRAGLIGVPGTSAYAAGKGGVFGLTNVASRDLAPHGITVNAVNPAATETRQVSTAIEQLEKAGEDERRRAEGLRAALQPPEQVAALITTLCHDASARFNGQVFYIEKGRVGLFHPLEVQREATTWDPWTVESLLEATARLEPFSLGTVYGS